MSKDPKFITIAEAVGLRIDDDTGDYYLIFKVNDPAFKQNIRENWANDLEFTIKGKELFKK